MRKIITTATVVIFALAAAIAVILIENNSRTPMERYLHATGAGVNAASNTNGVSDGIKGTGGASPVILNNTHTVECEFLNYEIIDDADIASQTKYKGEFFEEGILPDSDYAVEYTDFQAMMNDHPEVEAFISSNGKEGMTEAEYYEFLDKHYDEYTTVIHPESKYLFFRCRITNLTDEETFEYLSSIKVFAMCGNELLDIAETGFYYDGPMSAEDGYIPVLSLKPGESVECVTGCRLTDEYIDFSKDISYYVGFEPVGLDNYSQLNPALDKGIVAVSALQEDLTE